MKIVVTDGHTLNPGDLSWDSLAALGECEIYPRSTPAENLQRCAGADIAVTNKVVFDRDVLAALPDLKAIAVTATGYNVIDTAATEQRGIVVMNVPTYGTQSVAQMVFALLLELTQHVGHHAQTVREGKWCRSDNFCYWDFPLVELAGLTMGLVGFGRIGQATAALAQAFGMNVIYYDVFTPPGVDAAYRAVDLETLFTESDVVSLHCPLTGENTGMIDAARLHQMKNGAFLINTSRGPLVNEADLAAALAQGQIAGAAMDVLSSEPPRPDNPLLTAPNCLVTPHIAWATRSARARLMETTVANVQSFLAGAPVNVVT